MGHALGKVDEQRKLEELQQADVLCAPSLGGESVGMVLTEAFAAGTPVIASQIPGYRDVLREDPQDWDARYNLERALWLSPEYDDPVLQRNQAPTHSEHAASTVQGARIDLP